MTDDEIKPSVSYVYHTYSTNTALGAPFILIYLQCVMFVTNALMKLNLSMNELYFPMIIVMALLCLRIYNTLNTS
jgi:hypothetical protein